MSSRAADQPEPLGEHRDLCRRGARKHGFPAAFVPLAADQSPKRRLLLIVDAILVGWRNDVVRIAADHVVLSMLGLSVNCAGWRSTASPRPRNSARACRSSWSKAACVDASRKIADVPRLEFVVRNSADEESIPGPRCTPRATLPPGEAVSFRRRLASPPTDGRDVLMRFVTRHDIIAGTRWPTNPEEAEVSRVLIAGAEDALRHVARADDQQP